MTTLGRTSVLLGAGASADAGLPMTFGLATALLESIKNDVRPQDPRLLALRAVYGAMVSHRTEKGGDPLEAVNVETMISAIRLLRDREDHEVAPFVQAWRPSVGRFATAASWSEGDKLVKAVHPRVDGFGASGRDAEAAVRAIAEAVVGGRSNADLYDELELLLRTHVRKLLISPNATAYLAPLVQLALDQEGGVDIATLNYDLTVETCAKSMDVDVFRGDDDYRAGALRDFDAHDGPLRLYKIHGSIDLRQQRTSHSARETVRSAHVVRDQSESSFAPAIVVGDREKLGSGGSTVPLLVSFARALERSDRLVVIGYSFADTHVNDIIADWLDLDSSRTLTVLDPGWQGTLVRGGFQATLQSSLVLHDVQPRLHVIAEKAGKGLVRALTERPASAPSPRFSVTLRREGAVATLVVLNAGHDVRGLVVHPTFGNEVPLKSLSVLDADSSEYNLYPNARIVDQLPAGSSIQIEIVFDAQPEEFSVDISATEPTRRFDERYQSAAEGAKMVSVPRTY